MTRFSGTCNTGQLLPLPLIYGRRQVPLRCYVTPAENFKFYLTVPLYQRLLGAP